jgi:hypothetical protein
MGSFPEEVFVFFAEGLGVPYIAPSKTKVADCLETSISLRESLHRDVEPSKMLQSQRSDSNRQPLVYKTVTQKTQALKTQRLVNPQNPR